MTCRKISNQSGFTLIEIIATVVILAVFSAIMLTLISAYRGGVGSLIISTGNMMRISKSSALSKVMGNIYADYRPYPIWKPSTSYSSTTNPPNKILPTGMNGRFYMCTTGGTSGPSEPIWYDSQSTLDGSGVTWNAGVWVASTIGVPQQYNLGDIVIPTNPNGHFYRCIIAGTSGFSEPSWTLTGSAPVSEIPPGTAQWMELLVYLKQRIGPANEQNNIWYGKYYVVANRFVKFDSNNTIQPITGIDHQNVLEVTIQSVGTNPDGTDCPGEQILTTFFTANESGQ
jgi:prepilin-type N-terminal cleavage/methylation domain-containing protein